MKEAKEAKEIFKNNLEFFIEIKVLEDEAW